MCAGTCSNICVCVRARSHTCTRTPAWPEACPMFPTVSLPVSRKRTASNPLVWGLLQSREEAWLWPVLALSSQDPKCFGLEPGWEACPCHVSLPVTVTSHLPLSLFIYESLFWQADGTPFPSKSLSTSRLSFSHFWRKWRVTQKVTALCADSAPGGRQPRQRERRALALAPHPVWSQPHTHVQLTAAPETHSLHAGLVGIPRSVEEKARTCLSPLYPRLCHQSPPRPRSHPQLHPPCKSRKTNQTGSPASPLSSGILPKTSSSSLIYQPVILIF